MDQLGKAPPPARRRESRATATGQPAPPLEDAALARSAAAGDDSAAAELWNRFAPLVHRLSMRFLGSRQDSEDLTQEIFLHVFASLHRLRNELAVRSFVYSVAIRRLRAHIRSRRPPLEVAADVDVDSLRLADGGAPALDAEGRDVLRRLYRLLDGLTAEERETFTLRQIEGMRFSEIVQTTGLSLATVKRRLGRASEKFTALVEADAELAAYARRAKGGRPRAP